MTPELAARAFDLFVQGDLAVDSAPGGLGIGLTLVRRLAEIQGGTATVISDGEGHGSEFVVRLPAIPPSTP
jgi:signal transduction histidine kinase